MAQQKYMARKEVTDMLSKPGYFSHPLTEFKIVTTRNKELERLTDEVNRRIIELGHF